MFRGPSTTPGLAEDTYNTQNVSEDGLAEDTYNTQLLLVYL
jgi:hypothetical protein